MKNSIRILATLVLLPTFIKAQVDSAVIRQFQAAIIWRISGVCSKVALPADRQVALGEYFRRQDDLANQAMLRGDKESVLKDYYQLSTDSLKKLLRPLEFNDYQLVTKAKSWRLRSVISLRRAIGITTSQVDELLKQGEVLDALKNQKSNIQTRERVEIQRILTDAQYKDYFFKVNEAVARQRAQSDFSDLKKNRLCQVSDSMTVYPELYQYELTRQANIELLQYQGDKNAYDRSVRLYDASKPVWLYRLSAAKANTSKWRVLYAVYNKNELQLSEKQIDSLISRHQQMCKQDFEQRYGKSQLGFTTKEHENETLLRILTPVQLTTFLQILNKEVSRKNAQTDWEKLKQYKLVNDFDKERTINELKEYQLKLLVADGMNSMEKNKKNSFARQDIIDNKPAVLKELEISIKREREKKVVRF